MKTWFAVQENENDAWDYGTYDYAEAVKMAQEIANNDGEPAYIAFIDERYNVCDKVVEIKPLSEEEEEEEDGEIIVVPQ